MRALWRGGPPVAVMAAIFFFSSRTGDDLNTLLPFFQKWFPSMAGFDWGHFVAYFILGLTFAWMLSDGPPGWQAMVSAVLLSVLYGLTDEYHQRFVAGRMSDLKDLRNDGIGASIAMLLLCIPAIRRLYVRLPHKLKTGGQ
ncbi:VanZ family protein [Gorillibacterium sp. sgz5001074]|uniref:VanZ family protein n=1 Tax=Gorillibacterium sp. sgz5001074 TaxID=3446695 RepID=UPI003F681E5C